jgi:hypothetical protein
MRRGKVFGIRNGNRKRNLMRKGRKQNRNKGPLGVKMMYGGRGIILCGGGVWFPDQYTVETIRRTWEYKIQTS